IDHDAANQHDTATLDRIDDPHHRHAGEHGAHGRRRIEPAVSTRADVEDVLKKSSSIVDRMRGDRNTKRSPSSAAATLKSLRRLGGIDACSVGICSRRFSTLIARSAPITTRYDTALPAYAHATPAPAITTPPRAGPMTDATCTIDVFRLIALGRSSRGTRFGRSDCRAGKSN